jgi:hypothetical protein
MTNGFYDDEITKILPGQAMSFSIERQGIHPGGE